MEHAEKGAPATAEAPKADSEDGSKQAAKQPNSDVPPVSGEHAIAGSQRKRSVGDTAAAQAAECMPPPAPRPGKKRKPSYGTWLKLPESPADLDQASPRKESSAFGDALIAKTSAAPRSETEALGTGLKLSELPAPVTSTAAKPLTAVSDGPVTRTGAAVRGATGVGTVPVTHGTWLKLPEPPATLPNAAARPPLAMEDRPVSQTGAAVRCGAVRGDISWAHG